MSILKGHSLPGLTLSCRGPRLDRVLSLAIHISPTNGPIDMVLVAKLIYYALPIHFACSIIQIGLLIAKLQQVYRLRDHFSFRSVTHN
jgi:hypothetical protein